MSSYGQNVIEDDPVAVIEKIEDELDEAMSDLDRSERKIERVQRKLVILKERDEIPGKGGRR